MTWDSATRLLTSVYVSDVHGCETGKPLDFVQKTSHATQPQLYLRLLSLFLQRIELATDDGDYQRLNTENLAATWVTDVRALNGFLKREGALVSISQVNDECRTGDDQDGAARRGNRGAYIMRWDPYPPLKPCGVYLAAAHLVFMDLTTNNGDLVFIVKIGHTADTKSREACRTTDSPVAMGYVTFVSCRSDAEAASVEGFLLTLHPEKAWGTVSGCKQKTGTEMRALSCDLIEEYIQAAVRKAAQTESATQNVPFRMLPLTSISGSGRSGASAPLVDARSDEQRTAEGRRHPDIRAVRKVTSTDGGNSVISRDSLPSLLLGIGAAKQAVISGMGIAERGLIA
jgi:hypothetical protein